MKNATEEHSTTSGADHGSPSQSFSGWCVVELMGHVTLAGYVTEQQIGGTNMIRVDIPETEHGPSFTKLVGSGSIYGITPVDEETVMMICQAPQQPFSSFELQSAFRKYYNRRLEQELPGIEDRVRRELTHDTTPDDIDESQVIRI